MLAALITPNPDPEQAKPATKPALNRTTVHLVCVLLERSEAKRARGAGRKLRSVEDDAGECGRSAAGRQARPLWSAVLGRVRDTRARERSGGAAWNSLAGMPSSRSILSDEPPSPHAPSALRAGTAMIELTVTLTDEQLAQIAARAAALVPASTPEVSPWLNVVDAAERLRCGRDRIYDLIALGKLHPRRDGRRVLLHRDDLDAYLEGRAG